MDVDLYKSWSLVRIWNQTSNEVVNYTLKQKIYTPPLALASSLLILAPREQNARLEL